MYHYLTEDELKRAHKRTLRKNDILFHEDDVCEHVGLIMSGELEITSHSISGKEIIYSKIAAGGIFGNNLIFSNDQRYRGDVRARKDTIVYLFSEDDLLDILETNRDFHRHYLTKQGETIKQMNFTIKLLSLDGSEERLLYLLKSQHGLIRYRNITALASSLHLSREALSRTIARLEKENRITKGDHLLKLSEQANKC